MLRLIHRFRRYLKMNALCVIAGFHRYVKEIFALLACCASFTGFEGTVPEDECVVRDCRLPPLREGDLRPSGVLRLIHRFRRYQKMNALCVIAGFHRCVKEIFSLLACCAAYIGSYLPTFRDNLSPVSSEARQSKISVTTVFDA